MEPDSFAQEVQLGLVFSASSAYLWDLCVEMPVKRRERRERRDTQRAAEIIAFPKPTFFKARRQIGPRNNIADVEKLHRGKRRQKASSVAASLEYVITSPRERAPFFTGSPLLPKRSTYYSIR